MKNSNEKKIAAAAFATEWAGRGYEKGECQIFWTQFLSRVLGISNINRIAKFEYPIKNGYIDVLIPDTNVLIEQKSIGVNLEKPAKQSDGSFMAPYEQAARYGYQLPPSIAPHHIITCNFSTFRIYDRENDPTGSKYLEVKLDELSDNIYLFDFIVDPSKSRIEKEKRVSIKAAELIGRLYSKLEEKYINPEDEKTKNELAVLSVRLLFCLYAEDSGLFERDLFKTYLKDFNAAGTRNALIELFKVLNTPEDERDPYISDILKDFPYVNGGLFAEEIEIPQFDDQVRIELLLTASQEFDWSQISPVIFGSIFESILSGEARRSGGMHYTSVENIHKVIDPLFLDDLHAELQAAGTSKKMLQKLQDKIASLTFFDPACGSGNFLTETYLELRRIENEIIRRIERGQMSMDFQEEDVRSLIKVNVGQFYGIEINEFAVSVANTALWIADHQANIETSEIVDCSYINLPLKNYHHIICENALTYDWQELIKPQECYYILGNPPFIGYSQQSSAQKKEMFSVWLGANGKAIATAGKIDYVSSWFYRASQYIQNTRIKCAFVSTNSICQGEQVASIWKTLFSLYNIEIDFAWQAFVWNNEAKNQAHVHVVVIGFSCKNSKNSTRIIYKNDSSTIFANNICPYLIDAPNIIIETRSKPFARVPEMTNGNKPVDGGFLLLSDAEKEELVKNSPGVESLIRPLIGSEEYIKGINRWCLWLVDISPFEIKKYPDVVKRIQGVREFRLQSTKETTQKDAARPSVFQQIRQPGSNYIVVPRVSSERRSYVPIGFLDKDIIVNDRVQFVPSNSLYIFGVMLSQMHNAWMRIITGRLKSDYNYSAKIVYNNFPWPDSTDEQKNKIETSAQIVLDIRGNYPGCSLADLYDPNTMPPDLLRAHQKLDREVERAYGVDFNGNEEKIVAHLFKMYQELTMDES